MARMLEARETRGAHAARRDILYLTHEEAEPRLLRWMASPFGIQLLEARTGESAEEAVLRVEPALVIMDLAAFASVRSRTLRRLRAAYPELPIIALFDRFDGRAAALAAQDGANDYLTRPLDFTRWWAKIMPMVEGRAVLPAATESDETAPTHSDADAGGQRGARLDLWA